MSEEVQTAGGDRCCAPAVLCSVLGPLLPETHWGPKCVQRWAGAAMGRSTALWGAAEGSGLSQCGGDGLQGRPHLSYSSWKEVVVSWGRPLLPCDSNGMRGDGPWCARGGSGWLSGSSAPQKEWSALHRLTGGGAVGWEVGLGVRGGFSDLCDSMEGWHWLRCANFMCLLRGCGCTQCCGTAVGPGAGTALQAPPAPQSAPSLSAS